MAFSLSSSSSVPSLLSVAIGSVAGVSISESSSHAISSSGSVETPRIDSQELQVVQFDKAQDFIL